MNSQFCCQVVSHCQVTRLDIKDGRLVGVFAQALQSNSQEPKGEFYVEATAVALCASATGTPAILQRSDISDPSNTTGESLRLHPAVIVAGDFETPVKAWQGIPQSYECTEFLDFDESAKQDPHRLWIVPAFAHPVGTATFLPGIGNAHGGYMKRYAHLAVLSAMLHDETKGSVRPRGDLGISLDYWPNESDRTELALGLWACTKLLFAAGATSVIIPNDPVEIIRRGDNFDYLKEFEIEKGLLELMAVHPMASVPMGDDPTKAAVGSTGKHHHVEGVWVADASLFPSSIGVPPQLSTYAIGMHVGRAIAQALA